MQQSTLKTLSLRSEEHEAIFFSSHTSNYDEPSFSLCLGYYATDGDRYELSRDQLLSLRTMIDDHLKAKDVPTKPKYSNQFNKPYPPIGEGSFNIEDKEEDFVSADECFKEYFALKDIADLTVKDYQEEGSVLPIEPHIACRGNIVEFNPYGECLTKEACEAEEPHGHCKVCACGVRYGSLCSDHYNKSDGKGGMVDYNGDPIL